jgi:hypothetical protein
MNYFLIQIVLLFTLLTVFLIKNIKENFEPIPCSTHTNCGDCSSRSGCAWCPKMNTCIDVRTLKSTDKDCNMENTITSNFRCLDIGPDGNLPKDSGYNFEKYDFTLYKNRISNNLPPPNVYVTGKVDYNQAEIMASINNVRNYLDNSSKELPGIIASSVENNIKPMVKGILSENYYIQGFQDY